MSLKLILRLILASTFATLAIIYSELLPPFEGTNSLILKVLLTIIAGILGFVIFPEVATRVTSITLNLFNFTIHRISTEVLNQFLKVSRQAHLPAVGMGSRGMEVLKPLILDTSALIDGRILDIAKTGFISGMVLVPNFVLLELQQVADSSNAEKRARGRRGFEVVEELKKIDQQRSTTAKIKIEIWDKDIKGKEVDDRLINLAKGLGGKIVTTDYNLNRLAGAHAVAVLNVNDLANAVKAIAIPGEKLKLKIVHIGKDPTQGVGYLPDGTMIVVKEASRNVGKSLEVIVTKILQISAGRMIFAEKN